eukprot:2836253-Pleurochrysis_carterae.AAC.1
MRWMGDSGGAEALASLQDGARAGSPQREPGRYQAPEPHGREQAGHLDAGEQHDTLELWPND